MTNPTMDCDYLVVGAGACAMAFVDVLLLTQKDTTFLIVDKHAQPGGHWVVDYSFVTLHQPSAFYGVPSTKVGTGSGLELSSRAELLAYYESVMRKFVSTGRVKYFPLCECDTSVSQTSGTVAVFRSLLGSNEQSVVIRRRLVDTTYLRVVVPSMRPPPFAIEPETTVVSPNALAAPAVMPDAKHYTVVGAGKTALDVIVFLQRRGLSAKCITWIAPNDSWLFNREKVAPGQFQALDLLPDFESSISLKELLTSLEAKKLLLRVDPNVWPTKYRCAIVDESELTLVRNVTDVIRLGRVTKAGPKQIQFESAAVINTTPGSVFVDCTANGLSGYIKPVPIWSPRRITMQSGYICQPLYSAALIARIESRCVEQGRVEVMVDGSLGEAAGEDANKNFWCQPVPHPEKNADMLKSFLITMRNQNIFGSKLGLWVVTNRLNYEAHLSWCTVISAVLHLPALKKSGEAATSNMHRLYQEEFGQPLVMLPLHSGLKSSTGGSNGNILTAYLFIAAIFVLIVGLYWHL